jgi:hypothetical protein
MLCILECPWWSCDGCSLDDLEASRRLKSVSERSHARVDLRNDLPLASGFAPLGDRKPTVSTAMD